MAGLARLHIQRAGRRSFDRGKITKANWSGAGFILHSDQRVSLGAVRPVANVDHDRELGYRRWMPDPGRLNGTAATVDGPKFHLSQTEVNTTESSAALGGFL